MRRYHVVDELFIQRESEFVKMIRIRVLRIKKISITSLKDVVVLTQFSRDVHGGYKKMKHQRAGNSSSLFERRGQPVSAYA